MRLAVILSHPIQYYSPWFRRISADTRLVLRVFYLWEAGSSPVHDPQFGLTIRWDVDLLSGYEHEFVPNVARDPGTHHFAGLNNPTLRERLRAWAPDAILMFGYAYRTQCGLLLRPPAPLIFRGDSHLLGHRPPSWLKRTALRWIYGRCSAVTFTGLANRDYFKAFGVPDAKLHFAPHCVEGERFARTPAVEAAANDLRLKLGLAGKKIILFAGKFIPAKGPCELLAAFQSLADSGSALVFVGDGPEKARLEALAAAHPSATVRFLPFANQSEMPARYALADIFALPSLGLYETWGLAINEAMHMGVPCLVSDRVGCQRDLVFHGETGWVFPADNPASLRETLRMALQDIDHDTDRLKENIRRRISEYSYSTATAGLLKALGSAVSPS